MVIDADSFPANAVVSKDVVTFVMEGKVVGRIDATYDFTKCPSKYHELAFQILRRTECGVSSPEAEARMDRLRKYDDFRHQYKEEYMELPWYRWLFTKSPWRFTAEDWDARFKEQDESQ